VCCEDTCILISTLYGVSIYLNVGVSLSVFLKAVVGLNTEQAEVKHPRFSFVVIKRVKQPDFGVLVRTKRIRRQ
jgi:hypothetical protein